MRLSFPRCCPPFLFPRLLSKCNGCMLFYSKGFRGYAPCPRQTIEVKEGPFFALFLYFLKLSVRAVKLKGVRYVSSLVHDHINSIRCRCHIQLNSNFLYKIKRKFVSIECGKLIIKAVITNAFSLSWLPRCPVKKMIPNPQGIPTPCG